MSYAPIAPADKPVHNCVIGGLFFLEKSEIIRPRCTARLILLLYSTASLIRTSRTGSLH